MQTEKLSPRAYYLVSREIATGNESNSTDTNTSSTKGSNASTSSAIHDGLQVHLSGSKIHWLDAFYENIADLLQFPDYFTNNLDSFDEVINDLSWLDEATIHIYITEYSAFLKEENSLKRLQVIELLGRAAESGLFDLYVEKVSESLSDLQKNGLHFTELKQ